MSDPLVYVLVVSVWILIGLELRRVLSRSSLALLAGGVFGALVGFALYYWGWI
jgi:hypothetical protein